LDERLILARGIDECSSIVTLVSIAKVERTQGHYLETLAQLREAIHQSSERFFYFKSIGLFQEMAFTEIVCSREKPGSQAQAHLRHAARLLGAAQACQAIDWLKIMVYPNVDYDAMLVELQTRLDPFILAQAWKEGLAMSVDQATKYALEYTVLDKFRPGLGDGF
jgi:hypothetical protein